MNSDDTHPAAESKRHLGGIFRIHLSNALQSRRGFPECAELPPATGIQNIPSGIKGSIPAREREHRIPKAQ